MWELAQGLVKSVEFFGMSHREMLYWLIRLTDLIGGIRISDLTLDTESRPFLYAVPLKGISSEGRPWSFLANDFGVASGEYENSFEPLLEQLRSVHTQLFWKNSVPKVYGAVFASDMLQAEARALDRARFTADLISFSLRAGFSHFDTRYDSEPLEWDAEMGRSVVSLHPSILLREARVMKGWIRSTPLIERQSDIDLEKNKERIYFFVERFLDASLEGDLGDQTGQREMSERERKLSTGIQRSLRWLGVASNEENINDQFIATWIAMEAILDSIEYPGVFDGDRKPVRDSIRQKIKGITLPKPKEELLTISADLLEGRLLQNQWPLRRKLALFAKACGVDLRPGDSQLVRDLQGVRGKILHAGQDDSPVSRDEVRKLQYLIERLLASASVGGYEDLEGNVRHQLRFGEIGPEGGAAPLFVDGEEVPYSFRLFPDQTGRPVGEWIVDGKIYSEKNADFGRADDG